MQHQVTLQDVLVRSHNVCVNVEVGNVDKSLRGLKGKTHTCPVERALLSGQVSKAPAACLQLPYPVNMQSHRVPHCFNH